MKPEFSIGIDIEEIKRIKRLTEKYGERFLNRIFTKREI
ncbi:MAG: 4'-phosphopantetheinyl transferase superfamily protein, partial [Deltaproteobacteria bacterium]|nr:4'-phosphopantetheinyl transferase superfamily protein [Deltaproteobacteria bacterium]